MGDFDLYSFAILTSFVVPPRLNGLGTCKLFDLGLCRAKFFSVACVENIYGFFTGFSTRYCSVLLEVWRLTETPNKTGFALFPLVKVR